MVRNDSDFRDKKISTLTVSIVTTKVNRLLNRIPYIRFENNGYFVSNYTFTLKICIF